MIKTVDVATVKSETAMYTGEDARTLTDKIIENMRQDLERYFEEDSPMENFDIRVISNSEDTVFLTQHSFTKSNGEVSALSTGCLINTCRGVELYKRLATNTNLLLDSVNIEDLNQ